MSSAIGDRYGLGPIDQVGFVVGNIAAALPGYEALFGAFVVADSPLTGVTLRGREADCHLKLAVNRSGPIEIELIEVIAGETPHTEHLRRHGEGLHHIRFRVGALDDRVKALEAGGFETVLYKRFGPTLAFAYLEDPKALGTTLVELLEMP